jgi:perosamine synthetase
MNSKFHFFKGRVALYAILKSLNIKPGDEIIVPAFTCVAVPNAITYLSARPVYADISRNTFNINTDQLEGHITDKTKAIIAQHTFGIPAEMDQILTIAKKYGLYVIEDACHSLGSKYRGREVGAIGDAAFFSSQWSKPVTTGLGGWAIVNNPEIQEKMKRLYPSFTEPLNRDVLLLRFQYLAYSIFLRPSFYWHIQDLYRKLSRLGIAVGSSSNEELEYRMPERYELKMSDWQGTLLLKKLENMDKLIEHRKRIISMYEDRLNQMDIEILELPNYYDPVFLRYPLLVENKSETLMEAKRSHVELGDWFVSPLHPNLNGWEKIEYRKGMCPTAEQICGHIINLPVHMRITEKQIDKILSVIERVN